MKKTLAGAMSASPSPSTFAMCSRRPAISRWRERPSGTTCRTLSASSIGRTAVR